MDKIILDSGKGKTQKLIEHSAKTGDYIVCHSSEVASKIQRRAIDMDLVIPFPITYDTFLDKMYNGKGIKGFCIDDVELLLQKLTDVRISVITLSTGK